MTKQYGEILSVNISAEKSTIKKPVDIISIDDKGISGDAHNADSNRHVSLIGIERIKEFSKEIGKPILPGEFAENITTIGLDLSNVSLFDHFKIGTAELEVIQIGKNEPFTDNLGIFRIIGKSVMLHEGLFCRVISTGTVKVGDEIYFSHNNEPDRTGILETEQ